MADADAAQRAAAARQKGQAYLDQIIVRATEGKDPFQAEPPKPRGAADAAAAADDDPDVVAFGRFFKRHRIHMITVAFIATQGFSWVLLKGSLLSIRTPAVLAFLHMLAAAALHLLAVAYKMVPPLTLTGVTLKGSSVHVPLATLMLLVSTSALLRTSVYMLLCCVVLAPLLGAFLLRLVLRPRSALQPPPVLPLAVALAAAALELLADTHKDLLGLCLLTCYILCTLVGQVWQLLKNDATLDGRLADPELLFRLREISDAEEITPPATAALLQHTLLAAPVLLVGFVFQEGRELVEHEPSVPALSVMLLSCAAYAVACLSCVMLQQEGANADTLTVLTACAALLAIIPDFLERAHALGPLCLIGVTCCVLSALWCHASSWISTAGSSSGVPPLLVLPLAVQRMLRSLPTSVGAAGPKLAST